MSNNSSVYLHMKSCSCLCSMPKCCGVIFVSQVQPPEDDRVTVSDSPAAFSDSPAASVLSSGRNTPTQLSDVVNGVFEFFFISALLSF